MGRSSAALAMGCLGYDEQMKFNSTVKAGSLGAK
jgi:hypothetical protein